MFCEDEDGCCCEYDDHDDDSPELAPAEPVNVFSVVTPFLSFARGLADSVSGLFTGLAEVSVQGSRYADSKRFAADVERGIRELPE